MDENNPQIDTDKLSKKELKKIRRESKEEEKLSRQRREKTGSVATWVVALLIVIGGAVGAVFLASEDRDDVTDSDTSVRATVVEGDWKKGSTEPEVTLIEYGDFQCPACGAYHPILKQLYQDFGGEMQFVFRHFPLSRTHLNAEEAGVAAEAAGQQGKFWEMHDRLFENQKDWSSDSDPSDKFAGYAGELGLDVAKFRDDISRDDLKDKVSAQYKEGDSLGVAQTPTFFLNGERISNPQGYEEFKALLEEELNKDE